MSESDQVGAVTIQDFDGYLKDYVGDSGKLVLLLDYDGTISPIVSHPDLAFIPPETKQVLEQLSKLPDVFIAIVSGRNIENVKGLVGIDNIAYAGNHGLEILMADNTKFSHPMPPDYNSRVEKLLKQLQDGPCHDGAWVENKGTVLTFHYRETPNELRESMVAEAERLMLENEFKVGKGHCVLEARPPVHWNKGKASNYLLKTSFGDDWEGRIKIIYAGDDVTDEDAIQVLKGKAVTFRVTATRNVVTDADYLIPSTNSILLMLQWILQHLSKRTSK